MNKHANMQVLQILYKVCTSNMDQMQQFAQINTRAETMVNT